MKTRYLRIHGDNILECERTLNMLNEALEVQAVSLNSDSPIYKPCYTLHDNNNEYYVK